MLSTPVGTALYVGAVLGAGVLVLPGIVNRLAGPASLVAWAVDAALGALLAGLFATLGARLPGQAGVLGFVRTGTSPLVGAVAGWSYLLAAAIGQIIVPLSGALYVGRMQHWGATAIGIAAEVTLAIAVTLNWRGLRVSGTAQLFLVIGVVVVLTGTAILGWAQGQSRRFSPLWPHGWMGAAHAATLLFFAFSGWEVIASLSGDFRDRAQGLHQATWAAVGIVTALYLALSSAVVVGYRRRRPAAPLP